MKIRLRIRPRRTTDDRDARRVKSDDIRDRLSELPDSLILEILSLLPMRDMVRTSVLSKRWKDLWITLPFFNFKVIWNGKAEDVYSSPLSFKSILMKLRTSLRKVVIVLTWHLYDHSIYDFVEFLMKDGKRIKKIVVKSIGNKRIGVKTFKMLGLEVFSGDM
ncbi:hypothetical protein OROGR_019581 [Orobanche gracilis]